MLSSVYIFLMYMYVFNPFLTNVVKNILNMPNTLSVVKDLLLLLFFLFIIMCKKKFRVSNAVGLSIVMLIFYSILYIGTSIFHGRLIEGIYYYRMHFFPIIFFISSIYMLRYATDKDKKSYFKHFVIINVLSVIITISFYLIALFNLKFFLTYMGLNSLVASLYISYANFVRATAPQAGPNLLGLYSAINIFFLILFYYLNKGFSKKGWLLFLIITNGIILFLTFSRSAFLFLIAAFLILLLSRPNKFIKISFKIAVLSLIFLVLTVAITNKITDGKLNKWVSVTLSLKENSIQSRSAYISEAINTFEEYYLGGYPKGTVEPAAKYFGKKERHSCENSIFATIMDMGIFQFFILVTIFIILFVFTCSNVYQIALFGGMFANVQVLPNLQSYNLVIYLIWVFFLMSDIKVLKNYNQL